MSVLLAVLVCLLAPTQAPALSGDSGRYFAFRTFDSGDPPSAEQMAGCRAHFGSPRDNLIAIALDARLYSFSVDPTTGRVLNEATAQIGAGFICGVPAGGQQVDARGYADIGGVGHLTVAGPCTLEPVAAQPGAAFFNCKLEIAPDPASGILGGFASSNSVVNPRNAVPGNPTGSVWTAYVLFDPRGEPPATSSPPPPPASADGEPFGGRGAHFFVGRGYDPAAGTGAPGCAPVFPAARQSVLRTFQPSLATGEVPEATETTTIGSLLLCFAPTRGGPADTTGQAELRDGAARLPLQSLGRCSEAGLDAFDVAIQACGLTVAPSPADRVRGGLVASLGVIPAGDPAAAADAHVWTLAVLRD